MWAKGIAKFGSFQAAWENFERKLDDNYFVCLVYSLLQSKLTHNLFSCLIIRDYLASSSCFLTLQDPITLLW